MGLDIRGKKTGHTLSGSYSRLHYTARYLALVYCGIPDNIGEKEKIDGFLSYMNFPYWDLNRYTNMKEFIYSIQISGNLFPNLLMHSDCEGNYTKKGKDAPFTENWQGGNSKRLLKELEILCSDEDLKNHKLERVRDALEYTIKFRDLVKDEIENGSGVIIFG